MPDASRKCAVAGCERKYHAAGFCGSHYNANRLYGSPEFRGTVKGLARAFLEAAVTSSTSECVIWPFKKNRKGYGAINIGGTTIETHRLVCIRAHGNPPPGKWDAAHECGKTSCVNPRHISWKTRKDNLADCERHGTKPIGEQLHNAVLTEQDIREIRSLSGAKTQREIAALFGIHQVHVSQIIRGKVWGHVV